MVRDGFKLPTIGEMEGRRAEQDDNEFDMLLIEIPDLSSGKSQSSALMPTQPSSFYHTPEAAKLGTNGALYGSFALHRPMCVNSYNGPLDQELQSNGNLDGGKINVRNDYRTENADGQSLASAFAELSFKYCAKLEKMKGTTICKEKKHIPQDLIILNILTRIPCKSIIRYRCVCKLWCSLIYDSYFIKLHSDHLTKKNSSNLVFNIKQVFDVKQAESSQINIWTVNIVNGATDEISIKIDHRIERFNLCRSLSCNGLMCLIVDYEVDIGHFDDEDYRYYFNEDVFVFNLATRESLTLPKDTLGRGYPDRSKICLFGFHPPTKEYKVIQVLYREVDWENGICSLGCEVFTLGSKSWRSIGDFPYPISETCNTACVNGSIYCLLDEELKSPNELIVSLDLGDETFKVIPAPKYDEYIWSYDLVDLQGTLCFCCVVSNRQLDLWFLRDHASYGWVKEHTIVRDHFLYRQGIFCARRPITIHNGKILLVMGKGFAYYDPKSRSTESYLREEQFKPDIYMESLVCLYNIKT